MAKRKSCSKSVTNKKPKVESPPQAAAAADLKEEEGSSSPSKRRAVKEDSAVAKRVLRSRSATKKKQEVEAQPQEEEEEEEEEESSSPRKRRAVEEDSEMAKRKLRSKSATKKKQRVEKQPQAAAPKEEEEESSSPRRAVKKEDDDDEDDSKFVGEPVPDQEARQRWPKRYEQKGKVIRSKDESDEIILARRHYTQAEVDGQILYNLYDDAHVKAPEGVPSYIGKIVEMFEAVDGGFYFTAQWYYRAEDTVVQNCHNLIDNKRVFYSEIQNDNPLDCLIEKLTIARIPLEVDPANRTIPNCDYYCDMLYLLPYSTFVKLPTEERHSSCEASSTISCECDMNGIEQEEVFKVQDHSKTEVTLLDLYSGCGAMSTGLCLGANLFGLQLVTRWAVDLNRYACESLRLNHPETEVRNESAEDFLLLLEEWEKLCCYFSLLKSDAVPQVYVDLFVADDGDGSGEDNDNDEADDEDGEVFEVEKILGICYGDPNETKQRELYLKVRWKGYGADEDTWEPIMGLGNCVKTIKEFVTNGYKSKILPLPGDVDVICGGPPCQGISGFNRFRNKENPLDDDKNKQLIVYMNLVQHLKPRYVLMENVVDLVKFANGFLGRYALGRLIGMNYQVRMGMMAAGAYGLPQFRMRVFLWGAQPTENLPQFPLPTHDVVVRGVIPLEFEKNTVAHDEGHNLKLEEKLLLEDAISDLPAVENNECRDEMPYSEPPQTEFQKLIRLGRDELLGLPKQEQLECVLYDHRPLALNNDDYERVCEIPQKKGANFRDLPGVRICSDSNKNKVEWDPDVERVYLKSGKPLVPDYAMSFVKGTSSKPFARLWWDETVPTVVTRAEPHNQAILHPVQNRVLTIRENARLQGFPDCYKLCGPVKERYIQVGNAVAVPVARALGYALGSAFQGSSGVNEPVLRLPPKFPNISGVCSSAASEDDA
ncbi:DNA (cytosine-5)-methyltransferase CMT3-like [Castanea sativa]|uniref:DNA (cytosine-5)-methyltransferase CMT3-like n=1 Tax=Castanea sativa TaxID=21020 RepID=UPI003F653232